MTTKKYKWDDLKIGQRVLVEGTEYDIALKTLDETLYLQSVYTNERIIGEMKVDGRINFKLNIKRAAIERGKPLTPDMLTFMVWDDEDLFRARDLMKPVRTIWNDRMKCGHRVKNYEIFIDGEDNIVRVRFRCVIGCLTEWFEVGEMPLPHTHEMSVMKMEKTPGLR